MESGIVTNIQRYSLHDGPGIRTTVFLKGCPLRCPWCHNPETLAPAPELVVIETRCMRCGECVRVCPERAASAQSGEPIRCRTCGACVAVCPTAARQIVGQSLRVEDVVREVARDRIFYDDSGGGVTFSGGEPLLQAPFLLALLEACRRAGLRTAIDTCGAAARADLLAAAPLTHLFLYDIKIIDDARHVEYVGASNAPILENLRALGDVHDNIWVRIPVIPGINDDAGNLAAIARLAASVRGVRQVSLLPYHATGAAKFPRLGRPYALAEIRPPSRAALDALADQLAATGIPVKVGG